MKPSVTALLLSSALLSGAAMAADTETVSVIENYTCDKLVALEYAQVPTAVYYIEGFSDAGEETETVTEEDFVSVPVEKVYTYCHANPEVVVSDVISQFDDED